MSEDQKLLNIGLVMPIAGIEDCGVDHWIDVKSILVDALSDLPGYKVSTQLVSEGKSSGLIHKRIVQGLYNSHLVICDVSCKNPNVMFELGMRLAFDKPTIIVKDDKTSFTFDAGVIEHLEYPRDLRFQKIVEFKEALAAKALATYEDFCKDPTHSTFLKSFGEFKVATLDQKEITVDKMIIEMLVELQSDVGLVKQQLKNKNNSSRLNSLNKNASSKEMNIYHKVLQYLTENNLLDIDKEEIPTDDIVDYIRKQTFQNETPLNELDGLILKANVIKAINLL